MVGGFGSVGVGCSGAVYEETVGRLVTGLVGVVLQREPWKDYTALGCKYHVANKEVMPRFFELVQLYYTFVITDC